jgi:hypothetical protein
MACELWFMACEMWSTVQVETFVGVSCSHINDWEYFLEVVDNFMADVH